jgi:hypothetical protein
MQERIKTSLVFLVRWKQNLEKPEPQGLPSPRVYGVRVFMHFTAHEAPESGRQGPSVCSAATVRKHIHRPYNQGASARWTRAAALGPPINALSVECMHGTPRLPASRHELGAGLPALVTDAASPIAYCGIVDFVGSCSMAPHIFEPVQFEFLLCYIKLKRADQSRNGFVLDFCQIPGFGDVEYIPRGGVVRSSAGRKPVQTESGT